MNCRVKISKQLNMMETHYRKLSLYLAVMQLFLDLVVNFRFLSASIGPIRLTSTNGRNSPDVCHFISFTPITERERGQTDRQSVVGFHCSFM